MWVADMTHIYNYTVRFKTRMHFLLHHRLQGVTHQEK